MTQLAYDLRGRKVQMVDPDMGTWTYVYDTAGRLRRQTDAKSQVTTMAYDVLGRMVARIEPDLKSYWKFDGYDASNTDCGAGTQKSTGKPTQAWTMGPNLVATWDAGNDYQRTHCYDTLGRSIKTKEKLGSEVFWSAVAYETNSSRVLTQTYPASTAFATGMVLTNAYDSHGSLQYVSTVISGTTIRVWERKKTDAAGHVRQEWMHSTNGGSSAAMLTDRDYDGRGRLTKIRTGPSSANYSVQDNQITSYNQIDRVLTRTWKDASTVTETFTYDAVNRLSTSTISGTTKTHTYLDSGDLATKTGVGTYAYLAGTHRLNTITGTVNGVTNPSFSYDANGNILTGAALTHAWTSFNMPASIAKGGVTDTFNYGPEHQRIRQDNATTLTYYLLGMGFEKEQVKASGVWEYKHSLHVGGRTVALYVSRSDGTKFWRYLHQDNQGSTAVVTDHAAALVGNRLSFDAWGKRRNNIGTDATGLTHEVDRGYTGHEHLDNVGLIHMNGRVFDPLLARFVSADPFIKYPENIQNYGRYSYVLNDPLNFTDPDGFKPKKGLLTIAAVAVAIVMPAILGEILAQSLSPMFDFYMGSLTTTGSITVNAITGFSAGLVASGGDFRSAAYGALSGGMFSYAGMLGSTGDFAGQMGMHMATGCITGALGGGGGEGCARGAASAGFAKLATVGTRDWFNGGTALDKAGHFATTVIVGGTVSSITGGKFANGATTAAFAYIFNEATSRGLSSSQRAYNSFALSPAGEQLIKKWEGFSLTVYLDPVGIPTVGWGHVVTASDAIGPVGTIVTQQLADQLFFTDTARSVGAANKLIPFGSTQGQFDAAVSLIYNVGEGAFARSQVLRAWNAANYGAIASEWMGFNRAGGQAIQGLTNRRADEIRMFSGARP